MRKTTAQPDPASLKYFPTENEAVSN